MKLQLIADESVDFGLIYTLRKRSHQIYAISENSPGNSDIEVLEIANKKKQLSITEDKDFGEISYRLRKEHFGILLIRFVETNRKDRIIFAADIIEKYYQKIYKHFSVLTKKGIRIKSK